jgi:hypothetical protein
MYVLAGLYIKTQASIFSQQAEMIPISYEQWVDRFFPG